MKLEAVREEMREIKKSKLGNRCGKETVSDLMLLSIEKYDPVDHNETISTYKFTDKRIL